MVEFVAWCIFLTVILPALLGILAAISVIGASSAICFIMWLYQWAKKLLTLFLGHLIIGRIGG
jgi:hypothetical protein